MSARLKIPKSLYERRYFCGNCRKPVEVENAEYNGYGYGKIPACSYKCQLALVKKYEKFDDGNSIHNLHKGRLSKECKDEIVEMRKNGFSAQVIAGKTGKTLSSIYRVCVVAGVPFGKPLKVGAN